MKHNYCNKGLLFVFVLFMVFFGINRVQDAKAATSMDISKKNIVINKSGNYIITGSTDQYTLTVNKGVSANITLKDITIINLRDTNREADLVNLKNGATVNLILLGNNSIRNEYFGAAIHVPCGAKLMISAKSAGTLNAKGGIGGAGIGGSQADYKGETGTIIINGGTIVAEGGYDSCGIGGGTVSRYDYTVYERYYTGGGEITINGGKVTAIGGEEGGAAGIGGTSLTRQGKITITGGEVIAYSLEAGIGGEAQGGKGNLITITGGIVKANGDNYAAAIGNAMDPAGTSVTITGGMVTAEGDYGSRTLYEAYVADSMIYGDSLKAYDIAAEKIMISGGFINAYTLSKQPVDSKGNKVYPCFINCKKGNITGITYGKMRYGAKDIVSDGYLHLFLPFGYDTLTVKSGNKKLYSDFCPVSTNPLESLLERTTMGVDISKGDVEFIGGGCIFNNTVFACDNITISGTTSQNRILIHPTNGYKQNIIFKNVEADYSSSGVEDFIVIDNDVTADIHLEGENVFRLGDEARGIFVGNDASLCFSGEDNGDSLLIWVGKRSEVIYTNIGNVLQFGGLLQFNLGDNSTAIDTGNFGTFTLCGGTFEALNETGSAIKGLCNMKVNVYGGTLIADTLGDYETGNEEVSNKTLFTMTGGEVKVEKRIIFGQYKIYGGSLNTRILGCGTGCDVWMYGGSVDIGAYIDYIGETLGLDINQENILGGTVEQRNDVPMDEIDRIKTERG